MKCFAFQTIRLVVSRKKRGFSAHFGQGGAVPPPRVSLFSKAKRSKSFFRGKAPLSLLSMPVRLFSPSPSPSPSALFQTDAGLAAAFGGRLPREKRRCLRIASSSRIKRVGEGEGEFEGEREHLARQPRGALSPSEIFSRLSRRQPAACPRRRPATRSYRAPCRSVPRDRRAGGGRTYPGVLPARRACSRSAPD